MVFVTMLANSAYSIVAPFLPVEFQQKGISASVTGYVFAVYSVAVVVAAPFLGMLMQRIGRRLIVAMGLALMGVSFIGFAAINGISNYPLFITCALVARLL